MQASPLPIVSPYKLCYGDTQGKKHQRNQIAKEALPISAYRVCAEQDHISGLCIGEHVLSGQVGICVLEAPGNGEEGYGGKGLGHLSGPMVTGGDTRHFDHLLFTVQLSSQTAP